MDFKYTQVFSSKVKVVTPIEYCEKLSLASLSDLKQLFPADIDVEGNPDILLNAFNAAVANRINANDDGMSASDALALSNKFIHKPTNIEHNRKQVVGHIVSQGFSQFGSNHIITASEALGSEKQPFNISLGAVVWKTVDPDFASELVESSDESSSRYNSISASWEIGFNNYNILIGHRDYAKGELITDPKQVEELSKFLKVKGGPGKMNDNVPVYRDIVGGLPLGIGYTTNPAADVEGVIVKNDDTISATAKTPEREIIILSSYKPEESKSIVDALETVSKAFNSSTKEFAELLNKVAQKGVSPENIAKVANDFVAVEANHTLELKAAIDSLNKSFETFQNNEKSVSQTTTTNVKDISIMEIKSTKDITDDLFKETGTASVINQFIVDELKKGSEKYAEDFEKKSKEAENLATQASELRTKYTETQDALKQTQEQLKQIQEAQAAEKADRDFNDRMAAINETFTLNERDSGVVAKQIRGLSEEQYKGWYENFEVLASEKRKKKADDNPQGGDQTVASVLEGVQPVKTTPVANASASEETVYSKYKDAFSEKNIVINKRK